MATKRVSKTKKPVLPPKPSGRWAYMDIAFQLIDRWKKGDKEAVARDLASSTPKTIVTFTELLISFGLKQDLKQLLKLLEEV